MLQRQSKGLDGKTNIPILHFSLDFGIVSDRGMHPHLKRSKILSYSQHTQQAVKQSETIQGQN